MPADRTWRDYFTRFPYFTPDAIRPHCAPQRWLHDPPAERSVVLVHGLSDSPYFLTALARHFHLQLGYDVYAPLLQGHGLRQPNGMEQVRLADWKANLAYALDEAAARSSHVSVGGLSTGGTLSFQAAVHNPKVTGDVFLFSAALDLGAGLTGVAGDVMGEVAEYLLRSFLADVLDTRENGQPLIGPNPYRYARIDKDGARELAYLIDETDALRKHYDAKRPYPKRIFAAHSACDTTAHLDAIEDLEALCHPGAFTLFRLPKHLDVPHASVVLQHAIEAPPGHELEPANPWFDQMMDAINAFVT